MSIYLLFMACFVGITPILCCVRNISFQGVGGWVGPQFLWGNQNTRPSSSHPVFSRSVRPCLFLIKPFVLGSLSNQTDPVELPPRHDKKKLGTARVKPLFDQLIFSGRSLSMFRLTAWSAFTFFGDGVLRSQHRLFFVDGVAFVGQVFLLYVWGSLCAARPTDLKQ